MASALQAPFHELESYCMFVGYSRSGHTLVGSLLDAHPSAVIAHELDALQFVDEGVDRAQLFQALLNHSAQFTREGREWSGYRYLVPGQWHSRASQLRVLGDKKGGRSTMRLFQKPELLEKLRGVVGVPLRLVHVVRNPWDVIATMYRRRKDAAQPVSYFAQDFFRACRTNDALRNQVDAEEWLDVWHEDFIEAPRPALERMLGFFALEGEEDYLEACASIVYSKPHASRFEIDWPPGMVEAIADAAQEYDFLQRYSFLSTNAA